MRYNFSDIKILTRNLLNNNLIIRTIVYPYFALKILMSDLKFAHSESAKELSSFKDAYKGKRCFIIGNGPSLRTEDLEMIKNEVTFGCNRIFQLYDKTDWRPNFWMCVEEKTLSDISNKVESISTDSTCFVSLFGQHCGIKKSNKIFYVYNRQPFYLKKYKPRSFIRFSSDICTATEAGETVVYNAIQIAVYMGFTEIYLLGIDHNYSQSIDEKGKLIINREIRDYFGDVKTTTYNIQNKNIADTAYRTAERFAETHSIRIINCTRGGKLEAFKRQCLDEVVENNE